jgi:DNA-binding NtrC family response regulator
MTEPLTIMIVDADANRRFLLERQLKKTIEHCGLVSCASGDEALSLFRSTKIDALVTSCDTHSHAGPDFIAHARRRAMVCPIVLLDDGSDAEVERAAYLAGATKVFHAGHGDFAGYLRFHLLGASDTRPEAIGTPNSAAPVGPPASAA